MSYEDFVIQIGPRLGEGFQVRVPGSTAGDEASGILRLPELRDASEASCGLYREIDGGGRTQGTGDFKAFGRDLFQDLFTGKIRDRLTARLGEVRKQTGRGLRIRLSFDPSDPDFASLHSQPWELLDGREIGEPPFFSLGRFTPVVRYLEVGQTVHPRPLRLAKLRILVVGSSPTDQPELSLGREADELARAWRVRRVAEVVPLERADLKALREKLLEGDGFHILHFMGHGGPGSLSLQEADGRSRPATAEDLAMELRDCETLRAVFLNACWTATLARDLQSTGLPVVLGMQCPISDQAAIAFCGAVYRRLAAGQPIESAVTEGRLAIRRIDRRRWEWAVPVLYLRGPHGDLFDLPEEQAPGWNPRGLAVLVLCMLGMVSMAGLQYLSVWDQPFLRDLFTAAVLFITTLFGGLGWWEARQSPGFLRQLSRSFAQPRSMGACGSIILLAVLGWSTEGRQRLCDLRCAPMECPPPGVKRILLGDFTAGVAERSLAAEVRDAVYDKLRVVPSFQFIGQDVAADLKPAGSCVDFRLQGTLRTRGGEALLTAAVTDGQGLHMATVPGRGELLLEAQDRLALGLIKALGIRIDLDLRRKILGTPTADGEALRLNNEGVTLIREAPEEAEAKFREALRQDPKYASPANNLGMLLLERENPLGALDWFSRATLSFPVNPIYHYNLGLAHDLQGDSSAAASAYREAIRLDPSFARAYGNLGFVELERKRFEPARYNLLRALALTQDESLKSRVYKNLGRVALGEGDAEGAVRNLKKALDLDPGLAEAAYYLAMSLQSGGKRAEACRTWIRYSSLADEDLDRRKEAQRSMRLSCGQAA